MTESIKVQIYPERVGREKGTGRHFRVLEGIKSVIVWYMQYFMGGHSGCVRGAVTAQLSCKCILAVPHKKLCQETFFSCISI